MPKKHFGGSKIATYFFTQNVPDRNWNIVKDITLPIISAFSTFLTTVYIGEVNRAK